MASVEVLPTADKAVRAPRRVILDGESLTFDDVADVAAGPDVAIVEFSPASCRVVVRAADAVQQLLRDGTIAYGITTGFGAFKDRVFVELMWRLCERFVQERLLSAGLPACSIPLADVQLLQKNILISHAVALGPPLDRGIVRAIMLIRINTLARGHSGIRLGTLQLLADMLNAGVHPVIPEKGSLGASGDLAQLAHMSLPILGLGEAEFRGVVMPGGEALAAAGLAPLPFLAAKEGLSLTNGTAAMCAIGVLATMRAERLGVSADLTGCLSLEALHGTTRAFDARIHALRPLPRQVRVAAGHSWR